jgi:hypothetical protein
VIPESRESGNFGEVALFDMVFQNFISGLSGDLIPLYELNKKVINI